LAHTDDPPHNTGELIDFSIKGDGAIVADGLYRTIDIRRHETADDIRSELDLGRLHLVN
jgi:hypothetical protein